MTGRSVARTLRLSMAAPPLAWYAYQQGLGALLRVDCARGGEPTGLVWGILAAGVCLASALPGRLASRRAPSDHRSETLRLLAIMTLASAAFFGLAVVFQMAATAIIPPCAR